MELAVEKSVHQQFSNPNNWQIQGPRTRDLSTFQRRMRKPASRKKNPAVFAIAFSRIESSFVGLSMRYRPTIIEAWERNRKFGEALDSMAFSLYIYIYIYVTSCSRPRIYNFDGRAAVVSCTTVRIKHVEYVGTVITTNPLEGNYKRLTIVHSFSAVMLSYHSDLQLLS